eukprot:403168-Amphidinium_carterae.2
MAADHLVFLVRSWAEDGLKFLQVSSVSAPSLLCSFAAPKEMCRMLPLAAACLQATTYTPEGEKRQSLIMNVELYKQSLNSHKCQR